MKIYQQPAFEPVVVILESRGEADAFWGILGRAEDHPEGPERDLAIKLSNWFSNNFQA